MLQLFDLKDFDWTILGKITEEQLLGLTGPKMDDVYMGIAGSFTHLPSDSTSLDLSLAILDKQSNRSPDTVFDVVFLYNFADAGARLITIPDVAWGDRANAAPSRDVHVNHKFNFRTGNLPRILPV